MATRCRDCQHEFESLDIALWCPRCESIDIEELADESMPEGMPAAPPAPGGSLNQAIARSVPPQAFPVSRAGADRNTAHAPTPGNPLIQPEVALSPPWMAPTPLPGEIGQPAAPLLVTRGAPVPGADARQAPPTTPPPSLPRGNNFAESSRTYAEPAVPMASAVAHPPTSSPIRPNRQIKPAFRKGRHLVTISGQIPPQRCVKCGAEAEQHLPRTMSFNPKWLWAVGMFGPVPWAIARSMTVKKLDVSVPLCNSHVRRHEKLATAMQLFMGICIALMVAALYIGGYQYLIAAVLSFFIASGCGRASITLEPHFIEDHFAYLRGAGKKYLDSLPPFVESMTMSQALSTS